MSPRFPHPWSPGGNRLRLLSLATILFATACPQLLASEAAWRSSLYSESWHAPSEACFESDKFIQDFSYAGYERGEKPLPEITGPLFKVSEFGADATGKEDSTRHIQAAIDAAAKAGGGVVLLSEGIYKVSVPATADCALRICSDHIILRGAGPVRTQIVNTSLGMRKKAVILAAPSGHKARPAITSPLRSEVSSPSTTLLVTQTRGLKVGDWVCVRADVTEAWAAEHKEPGWTGEKKLTANFNYLRKLTSLDEATGMIQVDVPMRYFLRVRDQARICTAPPMLEGLGIEGFSISSMPIMKEGWKEADWDKADTAGYDANLSQLLHLSFVRNSWVKDVASRRAPESPIDVHQHSNGILLSDCAFVTLSRLSFARSQYGGANGNGYMYRLHNSQECLVTDCVAETCRHSFVFSGFGSSGNVLLRCQDRHSGRQLEADGTHTTKTAGWGSDHHMWMSHSNLIDSCSVLQSSFVAMYRPHSNHFLTAAHSVFWNTRGEDPLNGFAVISQQVRYGYVIGTSGPGNKVSTISVSGKGVEACLPLDIVEGEGRGESLQPQSLYSDQLSKRLHDLNKVK